MENTVEFQIKKITDWIENDKMGTLSAFIESLHPVQIAEIIDRLPNEDHKQHVFALLPSDVAAEVISELNFPSEKAVLENLDNIKLNAIFEEMPPDDVADIMSELSEEQAEKLLTMMDAEDSEKLKELLKYPEDTAGGLMNIDFITENEETRVKEILSRLQSMELEEFHFLYCVNDEGRFVGKVDPINLLLAKGDRKLKDIMDTEVITVPPTMDQEKVAELFSKYDLIAAPVIDANQKMIGRITVDDVIDVIREEANEDIYKMAGTDEDEQFNTSIFKIASIRLPWLLVTLLGGLMSCMLLKLFRVTLQETLALAFFVPIITAMGGNIGIQSSTTVVRGMATGAMHISQAGQILWREFRIGLTMGTICGSLVGLWAIISGESMLLGFIVGFSMLTAIMVAASVGSFTPLVFEKLKIDPTISSGPFVTMSNDITGLIIYFSLATFLLKYFNS